MHSESGHQAGVLSGEDWRQTDATAEPAPQRAADSRGLRGLNRSPLARKIIMFNLAAIMLLVAGVIFVNPFRDSLVMQREAALVNEAILLTSAFEAQLLQDPTLRLGSGIDVAATLRLAKLNPRSQAVVFDRDQRIVATTSDTEGRIGATVRGIDADTRQTPISDALEYGWRGLSRFLPGTIPPTVKADLESLVANLAARTLRGDTVVETGALADGGMVFAVASPILHGGSVLGVVGLTSGGGDIDRLVRIGREQVLQMFAIAIVVSIGLNLMLASAIANPLSDLASAAEIGGERDTRAVNPGRVRIPDLSARTDEIGRLSGALRGLVAALYDRIDDNEQFAADVAHEIKNPLASLRSAVGSLRFVDTGENRAKLLDVIDHDVRRLDRLVSDISNASRLDAELVTEDEKRFNLLSTLRNLAEHLGREANARQIDFIADLPDDPIVVDGLESRLAQVFVNLLTNAISFCEAGDVIRIWARRRENRVLIVVEDTGPGIPESALTRIFERFYSERPEGEFGNNSGLGLAISKQIVEAHGGVIWAENIQGTDTDPATDPRGARFVVGLPV